jgi:hypothetical protein
MSNPARIDAVAPVPPRTVRLVVALTFLSWSGMIVHDRISLPELSLLAPDVVLPTVVSVALFVAWWAWPGRPVCQVPLLVVLLRLRPGRAT